MTGERFRLRRRDFLMLGGAAGLGLAIGVSLHALRPGAKKPPESTPVEKPWMWLRIDPRGDVTVVLPRCELGQGVMTALPMLVVEELDGDWQRVRTEGAPLDDAHGSQLTGASDAIRTFWRPLRAAGAAARHVLIGAAAARWGVRRGSCETEPGFVVHTRSGRRLSYGELAEEAAKHTLPRVVRLKDPGDFRLLGTPVERIDVPAKARGQVKYGWDVRRPGMLAASVRRSPVRGGRLEPFDESKATALDGVHSVVRLRSSPRGEPDTVAVLADSFWIAERALEALDLEWSPGKNGDVDSHSIFRRLHALRRAPAEEVVRVGEAGSMLARAHRWLEATYETPFLAHATMEPMSCAAHVSNGRCVVWVGTQDPHWAPTVAANVAGVSEDAVTIQRIFAGGGFGRRQKADFVADAVQIATVTGVPVRLGWSREEDMRHGAYRPATVHWLQAGFDEESRPVAWTHRIAGYGGSDSVLVQGVDDVPYAFPHRHVELVRRPYAAVRTGPWRGLARSQNSFVTESFVDELAYVAERGPVDFRRELLRDAPIHRGVLELAAEKAGWTDPLPDGRQRGIALTDNFGGVCAQVAEVSVGESGAVRVHRVVCALDCGRIVNPDTVVAQMEGGIVFGLSAALFGEITIREGRVEQGNFDDFPVLRMHEVPAIEVHLVESDREPGGVGETAVPPIAPAVANAVFAGTGRRLRRLPIRSVSCRGASGDGAPIADARLQ